VVRLARALPSQNVTLPHPTPTSARHDLLRPDRIILELADLDVLDGNTRRR
jgi:hypothetical protein